MNKQFDYLLYFSIINYKQILLKNISNAYSNDILEPNINTIIPTFPYLYTSFSSVLVQYLNPSSKQVSTSRMIRRQLNRYESPRHSDLLCFVLLDINMVDLNPYYYET